MNLTDRYKQKPGELAGLKRDKTDNSKQEVPSGPLGYNRILVPKIVADRYREGPSGPLRNPKETFSFGHVLDTTTPEETTRGPQTCSGPLGRCRGYIWFNSILVWFFRFSLLPLDPLNLKHPLNTYQTYPLLLDTARLRF
jgi:hypothetical protein